uniref:Uncharacterized protein n=1 Tax=Ixodes ricinus TaxID=34613 RepID=A0A6B0U3F6_IXORI
MHLFCFVYDVWQSAVAGVGEAVDNLVNAGVGASHKTHNSKHRYGDVLEAEQTPHGFAVVSIPHGEKLQHRG